jgi:CysZ protein
MICWLRGFRLLAHREVRHFVWIPLLINFSLYGFALAAGIHYFSIFMNWLLPAWLDFIRWLLWPIFGLSFLLIIFFTFTVIANLIGAPFYGRLAEKVMIMTGRRVAIPSESWSQALTTGVRGELKRLGYFLTRAIPLLMLFLIPGVNLIAPFLWLVFSAWILAQEYMAYPLEAQGFGFDAQRRIVRQMRLGVFSFGGITMLGLTIPGFNILVPPTAVIGATLYTQEVQFEDETKRM